MQAMQLPLTEFMYIWEPQFDTHWLEVELMDFM